jgi:FMN phosphatase YigB (HAD superfamily)
MILVTDWHGTFCVTDNSVELFKEVAKYSLQKKYKSSHWKGILSTVKALLDNAFHAGRSFERNVEIFNKTYGCTLKGDEFNALLSQYVACTQVQLNVPVAEGLQRAQNLFTMRIILSDGVPQYIESILDKLGLSDLFDRVIANELILGDEVFFNLTVHQKKLRILKRIASETGEKICYVGNSWNDLECMKWADHAILSNLASKGMAQQLVRQKSLLKVTTAQNLFSHLKQL